MTSRRALRRRVEALSARLAEHSATVSGFVLSENGELLGPVTAPASEAVAVLLDGLDAPVLIPGPLDRQAHSCGDQFRGQCSDST